MFIITSKSFGHIRCISISLNPTSSSNAINEVNLIYDNIVARNENASFTTNSVWHKTLYTESKNVLKENVVNYAIAYRIPNYIDNNGPFVKLIEEIRDRTFIREFRKKNRSSDKE